MKNTVSPTKIATGFSLVEVAIALGIISFVLLAVVGMVGVGLDASKSAQMDTIQAATARSLISGLATNAFGTYGTTRVYINSDGTTNAVETGALMIAEVSAISNNTGLRTDASTDFRLVKIDFIHPASAPLTNRITNSVYASISR